MVAIPLTTPSTRTFSAAVTARLKMPALLVASLGAFAVLAPQASASECVNGYQELGNQVIVHCDVGPGGSRALLTTPAPVVQAPAGTVNPNVSGPMVVDDIDDCQPGKYRITHLEDGEIIIAC